MPQIKLQRIVSCSSQDPAFPAENLLSSNKQKWKCQTGEQSATVVIQLEKSSLISGIDIGIEGSAFIEVLVGRESVPDQFKVILMISTFTPRKAACNDVENRVQIFRVLHLSETEKWDRIKIVCTHPFNKHMQYGVAFITLHEPDASSSSDSAASSNLGCFVLNEKPKPAPKIPPPAAVAQPRNSQDSAQLPKPEKKTAMSPAGKRPNVDESFSSSRERKQSKNDPRPFNKLMDGVEFAISGYVNPGRTDIRMKAIEMGAKYFPTWQPTCTHLICAFPYTPKYHQACGKAIIVDRDWVDDSHRQREVLPWRRYVVDEADQEKTSEDSDGPEIIDLVEEPENKPKIAEQRNAVFKLNFTNSENTRLSFHF